MKTLRTYLRAHQLPVLICLLIGILLSTALACYTTAFPVHIQKTLSTLDAQAPLAAPDAWITADGASLTLADETASALAAIGSVTKAVTLDADSAGGVRLRLTALPAETLSNAFVLTDGRMPQNETECVIVPCGAGADNLCKIGAAVRPLAENGNPLTASYSSGHTDTVILTVVGIAENAVSATAALSDMTYQALIYCADTTAWITLAQTEECLLLNAPYADTATLRQKLEAVYMDNRDRQTAVMRTEAEVALAECQQAAETAADRVTAQQIALQEVTNRCDTALLRVSEAEENLLVANNALQLEKQEFVSDMEINEYYALRQTDLIPRRNLAEESYAEKQAEIDALAETLHEAYADRDAVAKELSYAQEQLELLISEQEQADTQLAEAKARAAEITAAPWQITLRTEESGCSALLALADRESAACMVPVVLLSILTVFAIFLVFFAAGFRRSVGITFLTACIPAALLGVLSGTCILPSVRFPYVYPALAHAVSVIVFHEGSISVALPPLLVSLLVSVVTVLAAMQNGKWHVVKKIK